MSARSAGRPKTRTPNQGGMSRKSKMDVSKPACLTYQLKDSAIRYHLPLKELLPSVEVNEGYLSSWPGHIGGEIVQHKQKFHPSKIDKQHGYGPAYASNTPKPRFLEKLEDHLRKELQVLDPNVPNAQEVNLQAYREVFEYFIEDLKTYKPLLSAIKNEYEIALAQQRNRIRELEPLQNMLVTTTENCEQRILALREEEKFEIQSLKHERTQLLEKIDNLMEVQDSLKIQVRKLQDDLATEYEKYREQNDARKLLISDLNNLRSQQEESDDSHTKEAHAAEDSVKLKLALKVAREDLKALQVTLNAMKAEYGDVIPRRDYESLEKNHNELTEKYENLQKHFAQLKLEHNTLLEVNKQITLQRDQLSAEVELLKTKMADPQMADDLNKTKEEYFEGLGTGEDVILFLRHDGLVQNMNLSKENITSVLKEIWKEKIADDLQSGTSSNLPEFFHNFLQKKYGDSATLWAYNIYYGCRNHQTDEFINLFFCIINGIVDESVYHGQMQLITYLWTELTNQDTAGKGILSKQEFSQILKSAFPNKTEKYINELITAATTQLRDSKKINYTALFKENEDDTAGLFITLLQGQYSAEKIKYLDELRNMLEDKEELTVDDLKKAFQKIDPSMDPQTLATYLVKGFQTTREQLDQASAVDTDTVLDRLHANDVKRIGPRK
ncbi:translin-associated factor X-interacting protein 1 isoform X2 [Hemitrygon akajei]|uniref:translin-associated factor X-interacting protein 1 isoform X2 n=1 Tax=Hemitrygon akajei TaxID=2704970 RepID=UPI003BFA0D4D